MRLSFLLIPSLAALCSTGCVVGGASGAPYSESQRHAYTGFEKVDASAGVTVIVNQGPFDVKAETTDGNDFDNLVVEVRGSTLHIGRSQSMFTVSAPAYSGFEVSSGASLDGGNLSLANLKVEVSSGASVDLSGSCADLAVEISSGASFSGEDLKCATADVDASSGASAQAFASQRAEGNASSGASVNFYGSPASIEKDSSSGGSVSAR